jgi:hypothetical protein
MDMASAVTTRPGPGRAGALFRPWRVTGTEMLPSLLVMGKLLFALLLCEGFLWKVGPPFLPFVPWLDLLRDALGEEWVYEYYRAYQAVFLLSGALLWLNIRPRAASVVLGLCVLFLMIGSKSMFRNHVFVVGCFFLLAGLSRPGRPPRLLYWQLSLIYLGAFLDKVLLEDWATGRFMDNFLAIARVNPVYLAIVEVLPRTWVAFTLSWASMVTELALGLGFLFRQTRAAAVWGAVLFHFSLYVFLEGDTFGHFLEDLLLAFIVVVAWPRGPVWVAPRPGSADAVRRIVRLFDWDRLFVVRSADAEPPPGTVAGPIPLDRVGWGTVLRRTAGFYTLLFVAYEGVYAWAPRSVAFAVTTAVGVGLMAFLAPAWPWGRPAPPREPRPDPVVS